MTKTYLQQDLSDYLYDCYILPPRAGTKAEGAKPGQKIALVGSTGAGKTTITNLLNRFYDIERGRITYDGINIKRIRKDDLRQSFGMVLQDTHLFTGTILDNIRYGRLDATDEECIQAAKQVNAHSFIKRLPQGYQTEITADGTNLSQGQRQLLAITRVAVADPPVMILDEATSSIDTRTERLIEKGMDALMENRTGVCHRPPPLRESLSKELGIEKDPIEECFFMKDEDGRYYVTPVGSGANPNIFSAENFIPLEWFLMSDGAEKKYFFTHSGSGAIEHDAIYYKTRAASALERLDAAAADIDTFLASPAAGYVMGSALQIDGGTHGFLVPPVGR